jgi:toxin ParE1/3/4
MAIKYSDAAKADLASIIAYRIAQPLPDPLGFVHSLRDMIVRLDSISHPGRKGRVTGTREWVIPRMPYIAVFTREACVVKIFRILHGAQQWP